MKAKRFIKWACGTAAVTLAAVLIWIGIDTYHSESKNPSISEDRQPTSQEPVEYEPTADFSAFVTENGNGENVFAISAEDFIACYNRVYRQTHEADYLDSTDSDHWRSWDALSPCFGYEAVRHEFSADRAILPMPTLSLYTSDNDEIYEFRMVFDDHGYQAQFREIFKELCTCMEKMLMPELSEAEAETLFEKLYAQSNDNFFGNHSNYSDPERPKLSAVYQYGSIGMYGFYGSGNIEICFVPLTPASIDRLRENGIPLPDWKGSDE